MMPVVETELQDYYNSMIFTC